MHINLSPVIILIKKGSKEAANVILMVQYGDLSLCFSHVDIFCKTCRWKFVNKKKKSACLRYYEFQWWPSLFWFTGAQVDDMDISPDTSPSSRPSSCAGTPQMGPASTPNTAGGHPSSTPSSSAPFIANIPQLINQISGGQNNQELTNKGKTSHTTVSLRCNA